MSDKLQDINENELKRQKDNIQVIESYTNELRKKVKLCSEKFLKELGKNNEYLLIKFDDLLCLEDIKMHGMFFSIVFLIGLIKNEKKIFDFIELIKAIFNKKIFVIILGECFSRN